MNFNWPASIRHKIAISVVIILISASCRPGTPEFSAIDMVQWKGDRQGCDGARMASKESFVSQKDKLLALSESEVVSTLGTPDEQELSKRNQKFYYYYLEPHGDCTKADPLNKPLRVAIRFNAMGLAKEVRIEKRY